MLLKGVLFIELLLVCYTIQTEAETQSHCYGDVSLDCPGVDFSKMNFLSVTWYKLNNEKKYGIIRRGKSDSETQHYNFPRAASFGEKHSLVLLNVTPEDSGIYECAISANVGGKNMNPRVSLSVSVCETKVDPTTVKSVLNATAPVCSHRVEDLPVVWSVIGYVAVGVAKIILSLLSIWVIHRIHNKSSRHKRTW